MIVSTWLPVCCRKPTCERAAWFWLMGFAHAQPILRFLARTYPRPQNLPYNPRANVSPKAASAGGRTAERIGRRDGDASGLPMAAWCHAACVVERRGGAALLRTEGGRPRKPPDGADRKARQGCLASTPAPPRRSIRRTPSKNGGGARRKIGKGRCPRPHKFGRRRVGFLSLPRSVVGWAKPRNAACPRATETSVDAWARRERQRALKRDLSVTRLCPPSDSSPRSGEGQTKNAARFPARRGECATADPVAATSPSRKDRSRRRS